ncbi:alcohol dehydrogenase [Cylindrobasidium torrendii FP15055 ss-10]|uniref:Alcohol dehydrogenase n=1 Tax=Cylindrobasidium torrendii FP15055 ss-10 TaxID=1314674 RepID=A0A0D7B4B1_9AGAR|nr:alcohol dehydrogenase [Cylindrobasidium torrendii FP15055 ss-10]
MAPIRNTALIFNEIPTGYPEPGKTTVFDENRTIDLENAPLNGGVLLKVLVVSNDPYLRGKMRDPKILSYTDAFKIGAPLANYAVGRVVRSESDNFKVGDHVTGTFNFEEYTILPASALSYLRKLDNNTNLPWSVYVGAAGMPGRTAYSAYNEFAKAKKGETIFVSTGAGAVGALVIQIAKRDGLKVIGSAGSDEKVAYMKEIGADVAFNYKTTSTDEVLDKEGPLDIYWDNVGAATLDSALGNMNVNGRIINCGMIAAYNTKEPYPFKNLLRVVSFSLSFNGFIVSRLDNKYAEKFYAEFVPLLASGEIKYREEKTPFAQAGEAIQRLQKGENIAKSVIIVADE